MRRVPQKRDIAERDVVQALQAHGFSVLKIAVKDGPDLVIAKGGRSWLAEVKTGKAKLKKGQQAFAASWPATVHVLRCVEDVRVLTEALK